MDCFNFLAIVNRPAMTVAGQVPVDWDAEFFGQMQRHGIAVSHGRLKKRIGISGKDKNGPGSF